MPMKQPARRPSAARVHADILFQFVTSTSRGAPPDASTPPAPNQQDNPGTKPKARARVKRVSKAKACD